MDKFGLAVFVMALGAATVSVAAQAKAQPQKPQNPSSSAPAAPPKPAAAGQNDKIDTTDTPRQRGVPEDYLIGAGDVLQVSVWKEPDASVPSVVVRPDGKIAMPLIREVEVMGMTFIFVEKAITEKLSKFINS